MEAAYTGLVATSLIDGKTTHTNAMLNSKSLDTVSDETKTEPEQIWVSIIYLIFSW